MFKIENKKRISRIFQELQMDEKEMLLFLKLWRVAL